MPSASRRWNDAGLALGIIFFSLGAATWNVLDLVTAAFFLVIGNAAEVVVAVDAARWESRLCEV